MTTTVLTIPQASRIALAEHLSEPDPLTFYAAALLVTFLFTAYSELGEDSRIRRYLVWLGVLSSPVTGYALGFGWIASALILLPVHVATGLVATDACAVCFELRSVNF